jgi:hypothetical protein
MARLDDRAGADATERPVAYACGSLSFPLGDLGLDEVSSASAKKGPGRGDPGLGSLNFGGDVRRGGRTVERKIKSGVEEGGGEPSSGNTPDKKTPLGFSPSGAFMARFTLYASRHHRRAAIPFSLFRLYRHSNAFQEKKQKNILTAK